MKRYLPIFILFTAVCMAMMAQSTPAEARKDRFAAKLRTFNAIVKELQTNYVDTLNADELMDNTIAALLYQIDPYTEYYPADDQDELLSISQGQYAGIGSVISKHGDKIIINSPSDGSPAKRAGLRPGDVILSVNGDTVTASTSVEKVSRRLRGQAGTDITVKVLRPYVEDSLLTFSFVRENIKVNPMPYHGVDSDGIGYIALTTFNESSGREVRNAVTELLADPKLKGIVIDLRGNGGGLLEGAVQIASNFVPRGTEIIRTRGRDKSDEKIYKTTIKPQNVNIPMAILTDGGTASASEILAGALQDLDRAVIVGDRSYGKGLVQIPRPLPYNDVLKITTGRYYIPSGRLIQAIDYSQRDDDGRPIRKPDSLTNTFHTKAGRIVRDGGGITPDIIVKRPEGNRLMYNIIADMWAFDYANRHVARNPEAPTDNVVITDSIFNDFKAFINPDRFKYDRQCETGIEALRKAAKIEGYMTDSVSQQFDVLAKMLKHDLNHDLDLNREKIEEVLYDEISSRYFDDSKRIRLSLPADEVYNKAKEILLDPEKYKALLAPQTK